MTILTGAKVPDFTLSIGGQDYSSVGKSFDNPKRGMVKKIVVTQLAHGPASFEVVLTDVTNAQASNSIKKGDSVQISMGFDGNLTKMMDGIVESVKNNGASGKSSQIVVKGFDSLKKLVSDRKRRIWEDIKDSDIMGELCSDHGLAADAEDTGIVIPHVVQNNLTDYDFLMERAKFNGYAVNVNPEDGKTVICAKPKENEGDAVLTWDGTKANGKTALLKKCDFDSKPQPSNYKVTVRSYDPGESAPIIGEAQRSCGAGPSHNIQISDTPVYSAEMAERLAQSVLHDRLVESYAIGKGECVGCPGVRRGYKIKLEDVGPQFEGDYYVTECRHTLTVGDGAGSGYWTKFSAYKIP